MKTNGNRSPEWLRLRTFKSAVLIDILLSRFLSKKTIGCQWNLMIFKGPWNTNEQSFFVYSLIIFVEKHIFFLFCHFFFNIKNVSSAILLFYIYVVWPFYESLYKALTIHTQIQILYFTVTARYLQIPYRFIAIPAPHYSM